MFEGSHPDWHMELEDMVTGQGMQTLGMAGQVGQVQQVVAATVPVPVAAVVEEDIHLGIPPVQLELSGHLAPVLEDARVAVKDVLAVGQGDPVVVDVQVVGQDDLQIEERGCPGDILLLLEVVRSFLAIAVGSGLGNLVVGAGNLEDSLVVS